MLPARQLDFHDPLTARIFAETHDLAAWVVNYDELLDRRQLRNQKVSGSSATSSRPRRDEMSLFPRPLRSASSELWCDLGSRL